MYSRGSAGAAPDVSESTAAILQAAGARISVWWDIENCAVPSTGNAHEVAANIRNALVDEGLHGAMTISAYGDTNQLPRKVSEGLTSTGISLHHVPNGRKDASDKAILAGLFLWALDNPPPAHIFLISGDQDFSNALHGLRLRRYNILIAVPPGVSVSPSLMAAATKTWDWKSLVLNGRNPDSPGKTAKVLRATSHEHITDTTDSSKVTSPVIVEKVSSESRTAQERVTSESPISDPLQGKVQTSNNLQFLAEVLNTLRQDKLPPNRANITSRIRQLAVAKNMTSDLQGLSKSFELAIASGYLVVKQDHSKGSMVLLRSNPVCWPCVDPWDARNPYPETMWTRLLDYLRSGSGQAAIQTSKSRYNAAEILKNTGPEELRDLALGELIHIVQLMITKKGWLIPANSASNWEPITIHIPETKRNTACGSSAKPAATDSLQKVLGISLARGTGIITLSNKSISSSGVLPWQTVTSESSRTGPLATPITLGKVPLKPVAHVSSDPCLGSTADVSNEKARMLKDLETLLHEIVLKHPGGYLQGGVKSLFSERFSYTLDNRLLGYPSLTALLEIFPHVVQLEKPGTGRETIIPRKKSTTLTMVAGNGGVSSSTYDAKVYKPVENISGLSSEGPHSKAEPASLEPCHSMESSLSRTTEKKTISPVPSLNSAQASIDGQPDNSPSSSDSRMNQRKSIGAGTWTPKGPLHFSGASDAGQAVNSGNKKAASVSEASPDSPKERPKRLAALSEFKLWLMTKFGQRTSGLTAVERYDLSTVKSGFEAESQLILDPSSLGFDTMGDVIRALPDVAILEASGPGAAFVIPTRSLQRDLTSFLGEGMKKNPKGFDMAQVKPGFEVKFGYSLDYSSLGFKKLRGLLESMPDVVRVEQGRKGVPYLLFPGQRSGDSSPLEKGLSDKMANRPSPSDSLLESSSPASGSTCEEETGDCVGVNSSTVARSLESHDGSGEEESQGDSPHQDVSVSVRPSRRDFVIVDRAKENRASLLQTRSSQYAFVAMSDCDSIRPDDSGSDLASDGQRSAGNISSLPYKGLQSSACDRTTALESLPHPVPRLYDEAWLADGPAHIMSAIGVDRDTAGKLQVEKMQAAGHLLLESKKAATKGAGSSTPKGGLPFEGSGYTTRVNEMTSGKLGPSRSDSHISGGPTSATALQLGTAGRQLRTTSAGDVQDSHFAGQEAPHGNLCAQSQSSPVCPRPEPDEFFPRHQLAVPSPALLAGGPTAKKGPLKSKDDKCVVM